MERVRRGRTRASTATGRCRSSGASATASRASSSAGPRAPNERTRTFASLSSRARAARARLARRRPLASARELVDGRAERGIVLVDCRLRDHRHGASRGERLLEDAFEPAVHGVDVEVPHPRRRRSGGDRRSASSSSSRVSPAANACGSPASTSRPFTPSSTISGNAADARRALLPAPSRAPPTRCAGSLSRRRAQDRVGRRRQPEHLRPRPGAEGGHAPPRLRAALQAIRATPAPRRRRRSSASRRAPPPSARRSVPRSFAAVEAPREDERRPPVQLDGRRLVRPRRGVRNHADAIRRHAPRDREFRHVCARADDVCGATNGRIVRCAQYAH